MSSGVRFCSKCNNLLSPVADKEKHALVLRCKTCREEVQAGSNVVYSYTLKKKAETKLEAVDASVIMDPTLPRAKDARCGRCGNHEAVFFQGDSGRDSDMALIFVCVKCKNKWLG